MPLNVSFAYCRGELKDNNWDALRTNRDILKTRLDVCQYFEFKGNLTDSTERNTG